MLQNLRTRTQSEEGFTLIELLVVILIIGILAAIALPTFLGQRSKAQDSAAKSDTRNAITQLESCLVDSSYALCKVDPEVTAFATPSTAGDENSYSVAKASASGVTFTITKSSAGQFARTKTGGGTW